MKGDRSDRVGADFIHHSTRAWALHRYDDPIRRGARERHHGDMPSTFLRPIPTDFDRLPTGGPFLGRQARAWGVTPRQLHSWTADGLLVRPLRGVYHRGDTPDSLGLRVQCVRLVVPGDAVVTDRTAAWLHGATMALAPNDHLMVPRVQLFCSPGNRLRSAMVTSGERGFLDRDLERLDGLTVTTPLRTACDLGRLLDRDSALGAMDALHALGGFTIEQLVREETRFKGYRGVRQFRALVALVDGRAQSPGESALRLRWYDAGLPTPTLQCPVPGPAGSTYYLDLGLPCCRLGAEYDGAAFHGDEHRGHDDRRRAWIRVRQGWTLAVLDRANVFGHNQDAWVVLREAATKNPHRCSQHRFF